MNSIKTTACIGLFVSVFVAGFGGAPRLAPHQDLAAAAAQEDVSSLARMSKSNGALVQRESHELKSVSTSYGKDVECTLLVLKNLIGTVASEGQNPIGGLVFSVDEKYGSKSLYVDLDEIEGILAAMLFLEEEGLEVVKGTIVTPPSSSKNKSTEIHYSTRDGLTLGVFLKEDQLTYALKIGRTADWAILSKVGAIRLKKNLEQASKALADLK